MGTNFTAVSFLFLRRIGCRLWQPILPQGGHVCLQLANLSWYQTRGCHTPLCVWQSEGGGDANRPTSPATAPVQSSAAEFSFPRAFDGSGVGCNQNDWEKITCSGGAACVRRATYTTNGSQPVVLVFRC